MVKTKLEKRKTNEEIAGTRLREKLKKKYQRLTKQWEHARIQRDEFEKHLRSGVFGALYWDKLKQVRFHNAQLQKSLKRGDFGPVVEIKIIKEYIELCKRQDKAASLILEDTIEQAENKLSKGYSTRKKELEAQRKQEADSSYWKRQKQASELTDLECEIQYGGYSEEEKKKVRTKIETLEREMRYEEKEKERKIAEIKYSIGHLPEILEAERRKKCIDALSKKIEKEFQLELPKELQILQQEQWETAKKEKRSALKRDFIQALQQGHIVSALKSIGLIMHLGLPSEKQKWIQEEKKKEEKIQSIEKQKEEIQQEDLSLKDRFFKACREGDSSTLYDLVKNQGVNPLSEHKNGYDGLDAVLSGLACNNPGCSYCGEVKHRDSAGCARFLIEECGLNPYQVYNPGTIFSIGKLGGFDGMNDNKKDLHDFFKYMLEIGVKVGEKTRNYVIDLLERHHVMTSEEFIKSEIKGRESSIRKKFLEKEKSEKPNLKNKLKRLSSREKQVRDLDAEIIMLNKGWKKTPKEHISAMRKNQETDRKTVTTRMTDVKRHHGKQQE